MMCDGYGLYGKFYMGPQWGSYWTHKEYPCGPHMELVAKPTSLPCGQPILDSYRNPFESIWVQHVLPAGLLPVLVSEIR